MKFFKYIILFMLLLLSLIFYACENKPTKDKNVNNPLILNYGNVTLLQSKNGKINAYSIKNGNLDFLGKLPKNSEFLYNKERKQWIFLLKKEDGKNLIHNEIAAIDGGTEVNINDFYSASDLRLSPEGHNLIFRNFKKDSLESVGPIKIYDFPLKKEDEIETKVLISGDVYDFLGDNDICYYGLLPQVGRAGAIYKYNIKSKKESVLLSSLNGYCTYIKGINSEYIFYLDKGYEYCNLNLYDLNSKSIIPISDSITDIFKSVYNNKSHDIFFIARNLSSEVSLYKYNLINKTLTRLTYDFPSKVDLNGGLGISDEGIYFCGDFDTFNKVYFYNIKDGSINLIKDEEAYYKVYFSN